MSISPGKLRMLAAETIAEIVAGKSLAELLAHARLKNLDERDHAFIQAVAYGVCRYYFQLDVVLANLLNKPLPAKAGLLHALLLVGLYQLMHMRIPPHAAVAETVNAAAQLKAPWAKGLVNAILRSYLREKDSLLKIIEEDDVAYYAHPEWMVSAIKSAWPEDWQAILTENNMHPPFTLRVNAQHHTREAYLAALQQKFNNELEDKAEPAPEAPSGIFLQPARSVESLPGFSEGDVSVQDSAAQLAAPLLKLTPNLHILDVCAAPGGKLNHILECEPTIKAVAVEIDAVRLEKIHQNLNRLQQHAECICADALDVKKWWNGELFDRILLDAPCSASGVIRRHPDIKLLRFPNDLTQFATTQLELLEAVWPLLKPNGLLLYVTCSIFPEENVEVVQRFLKQHPEACEDPLPGSWGINCVVGKQILPGKLNMDGFYYARIKHRIE